MQKVIVFLSAIFFLVFTTSFRTPKKDKINWMTVSELQVAYSKNPRPVLVDVYTHWCTWCKVMDKETYSNDKVASYINEHYYAVRLDAENKDSLSWDGKKFGYNLNYKANELALYLTSGQMSFPTTVFLADINAQPAPLPGFLKPGEIEPPLKYFGDGFYKSQNFQDYYKSFNASW
jgi:thioredoxin-related protein